MPQRSQRHPARSLHSVANRRHCFGYRCLFIIAQASPSSAALSTGHDRGKACSTSEQGTVLLGAASANNKRIALPGQRQEGRSELVV